MNRRTKKLIRRDMQLKVVAIALFVAGFAMLIQFQLGLSGLWGLSNRLTAGITAELVLEQARVLFVNKFIVSLMIAVPLAISVGILYSYKFSGPVFRFGKYFEDMAAGRWDQSLILRESDDLHDVSEAINAALDQVRTRLQESHELLTELDAFFEHAGFTADGHSMDRLGQLRERIARQRAAHVQRFPTEAEPARPQRAPELSGVPQS
jgi:methyl-accepting chemotaxis protein